MYGGISDLAYTPLADTWELQFAEAHRCRLTSPSCSDDADCDAVGATVGVQPGIFKCCLGAAMCSPAQLGTCVLPSTCDLAVHQLFPATPCPDGTATGCGAGEICSSAHLCVPPAHRSHVCSWGLVDATGAAKPSWEALVSSAESFVP